MSLQAERSPKRVTYLRDNALLSLQDMMRKLLIMSGGAVTNQTMSYFSASLAMSIAEVSHGCAL